MDNGSSSARANARRDSIVLATRRALNDYRSPRDTINGIGHGTNDETLHTDMRAPVGRNTRPDPIDFYNTYMPRRPYQHHRPLSPAQSFRSRTAVANDHIFEPNPGAPDASRSHRDTPIDTANSRGAYGGTPAQHLGEPESRFTLPGRRFRPMGLNRRSEGSHTSTDAHVGSIHDATDPATPSSDEDEIPLLVEHSPDTLLGRRRRATDFDTFHYAHGNSRPTRRTSQHRNPHGSAQGSIGYPPPRLTNPPNLADMVDETHSRDVATQFPNLEAALGSVSLLLPTDLPNENQACPVCMEEYQTLVTSETPVLLACGHIIGNGCLLTWLNSSPLNANNNTCPNCRAVLYERPTSRPFRSWLARPTNERSGAVFPGQGRTTPSDERLGAVFPETAGLSGQGRTRTSDERPGAVFPETVGLSAQWRTRPSDERPGAVFPETVGLSGQGRTGPSDERTGAVFPETAGLSGQGRPQDDSDWYLRDLQEEQRRRVTERRRQQQGSPLTQLRGLWPSAVASPNSTDGTAGNTTDGAAGNATRAQGLSEEGRVARIDRMDTIQQEMVTRGRAMAAEERAAAEVRARDRAEQMRLSGNWDPSQFTRGSSLERRAALMRDRMRGYYGPPPGTESTTNDIGSNGARTHRPRRGGI